MEDRAADQAGRPAYGCHCKVGSRSPGEDGEGDRQTVSVATKGSREESCAEGRASTEDQGEECKVTFGSLFSGIGGLDLGLERAGMTCKWQSEIDPYASQVLKKHWPEVPNYGDITKIDWNGVERVDLICGGFPCQPHSLAGKREGADDERNLWPEVVRCLRETEARWFLGENVAGLLSSDDGRMFATILGDLAALGFDATWGSLRASDFGAPHRRERVFLLAYRSGERCGEARGLRSGSLAGIGSKCAELADASGKGRQITKFSYTLQRNRQRRKTHGPVSELHRALAAFPPRPNDAQAWADVINRCPWLAPAISQEEAQSLLRGMANGLPDPLDARTSRLKALGNSVVPKIARFVGEIILEAEGRMK